MKTRVLFGLTCLVVPLILHGEVSGQGVPGRASARRLGLDEMGHPSPGGTTASVGDPRADFTIIVLGDTQFYTCGDRCEENGDPATFVAQTQWIVDNEDAMNTVFVSHMGDCTQHGDNFEEEWERGDAAMSILESTGGDGMPYGLAPGNHDMTPNGGPDGTTVMFNQYFGVGRFEGREYYGGHYGTDNDNNFQLFSGGGMEFIIIHLSWCNCPPGEPDTEIIAWADDLLKTYSDRRAIITSHFLLGGSSSCTQYAGFSAQGQRVYDRLKHNPNLFLMLCGHVNAGKREEMFEGRSIYAYVTNYQLWPNGGDGWLRILEFSLANNEIRVSTYSPTLDDYLSDCRTEFTWDYDMSCPDPPPGNLDFDCDVDMFEYAAFLECVSGVGGGVSPGCQTFDFDGDGDVDLADFGAFQSAFTGSL